MTEIMIRYEYLHSGFIFLGSFESDKLIIECEGNKYKVVKVNEG